MVELSDIKNEIEKAWNFSKSESEHEFKKHCIIAKVDPDNIEHYIKDAIQKLSDFSDSCAGNYFINTPGIKIKTLDDIIDRLANTYNYGIIGKEYRDQIMIPGWDIEKASKKLTDFIFGDSRTFFLKIQTINLLNDLLDKINETRNQKQKTVCPKLKTNKAQSIFKKAIIENDPIIYEDANGYIWKGDKQLLAYFAEKMSLYLSLTSKIDKDGKTTISWIPLENAFGIKGLKNAKNSWMKYNTLFTPTGYERVNKWFE